MVGSLTCLPRRTRRRVASGESLQLPLMTCVSHAAGHQSAGGRMRRLPSVQVLRITFGLLWFRSSTTRMATHRMVAAVPEAEGTYGTGLARLCAVPRSERSFCFMTRRQQRVDRPPWRGYFAWRRHFGRVGLCMVGLVEQQERQATQRHHRSLLATHASFPRPYCAPRTRRSLAVSLPRHTRSRVAATSAPGETMRTHTRCICLMQNLKRKHLAPRDTHHGKG